MKITSLRLCLLALVARCSGNGSIPNQPPQNFVNKPPLPVGRPILKVKSRAPHWPADQRMTASPNQRQRRKARRSACAAGCRNAFTRGY